MGAQTMAAGLDLTCHAAGTLPGEIRRRIEYRLAAWGLDRLAHDICLCADELVTNACTATPDGPIRIRFTRERGSLLLAVWDASTKMPAPRAIKELTLEDLDLSPENFDENGGWGLHLIEALSAESGTEPTSPAGKWVWARFAL